MGLLVPEIKNEEPCQGKSTFACNDVDKEMENDSTYPQELITRYFTGETEGDDLVTLADWLKADPSHRKAFEEYRKTWGILEKSRLEDQLDLDQAWSEFNTLAGNDPDSQVHDFSVKLGGNRISFTPAGVLRYAAIFFVLLFPAVILYHYYTKPATKLLTASQSVVEGTLPDGSMVTLNTGSHIEYPARFDRFKRGVVLQGAAYFEVTHNTGTPFVIYYNNARVEVLGTKFYVNTNAENGKMEVILKEGSVSVYFKNHPNESVTLAPGEKAEITAEQNAIGKRVNEDENYLAWMTQELVFNNEELGQITATLNNVYHSTIRITNPKIGKCHVTATFDHQSLDSVLKVLKATLGLEITMKGNVIEISGNPCE